MISSDMTFTIFIVFNGPFHIYIYIVHNGHIVKQTVYCIAM